MRALRTADDVPRVLADRLSAVAWRLAGARVLEIAPAMPAAELLAALEDACASSARVLVTAGVATRLPADALARRVRGAKPLVAFVDSAAGDALRAAPSGSAQLAASGARGAERGTPAGVADAVQHARRVLGVAS